MPSNLSQKNVDATETVIDKPSLNNNPEPVEEEIPEIDLSNLITEDEIKQKQDEDRMYSQIKECLVQNLPPSDDIRYVMEEFQPMAITENQLLYRETNDGLKLTVIPEPLIEKVIESLHIISPERHLDGLKTIKRVEQLYFWPFYTDTIHDFVNNCNICKEKQ